MPDNCIVSYIDYTTYFHYFYQFILKNTLWLVVKYNYTQIDTKKFSHFCYNKIGKTDFVNKPLRDAIKELVLEKHFSLYVTVQHFNYNGWSSNTRVCTKSIYNYINAGYITGLERGGLQNKGIRYKEKGSTRIYNRAKCAQKSIEYRSKEVDIRTTSFHWEIDTVKRGQGKSATWLFTMTECLTRFEIATIIPNAKYESVVAVFDKIEQKIGTQKFCKMVRMITADGGSESMDFEGIERSINNAKRTKIVLSQSIFCL